MDGVGLSLRERAKPDAKGVCRMSADAHLFALNSRITALFDEALFYDALVM